MLKSSKTSLTQFFFWAPRHKENIDKFVQGKVVAWSLDFSSKWQLSIHLYISLVHFILTGQEICRICLNFTLLAQLMVDGLLMNQSERFSFVML